MEKDVNQLMKRWRSNVLRLLTDIGVYYTTASEHQRACWDRVNRFVSSPKLAGKEFYYLSVEELQALAVKLRGIKQKGYRYQREGKSVSPNIEVFLPISSGGNGTAS